MPNPKRRHSNQRTRLRRTHYKIKAYAPNHCGRCGAAVRSHRVCDNCGYYGFSKGGEKKGTDVLQKEVF
ncbi:MAG: 50S ribosomal protein L32 [Planctomycetes bacterium]|nr:50S ribosomal protein L32 [Planctomycetota bacterium]